MPFPFSVPNARSRRQAPRASSGKGSNALKAEARDAGQKPYRLEIAVSRPSVKLPAEIDGARFIGLFSKKARQNQANLSGTSTGIRRRRGPNPPSGKRSASLRARSAPSRSWLVDFRVLPASLAHLFECR